MTPDAVPVAVHGFTWTAALVGLLNLLVGGAFVAWIKQRPAMAEIEKHADERLQESLLARVDLLEKRLDEETRRRERDAEKHAALIGLMRHRLNNSDQCIDSLLLLLKNSPEKVKEAVALIEDMRARQREAEAIEKAAINDATMRAMG